MTDIPQWWMKGDWFDVCSCNIPCPCEFAQPPTNNHCDGVMAYHIREDAYGDGFSVIAVLRFDATSGLGTQTSYSAFSLMSVPTSANATPSSRSFPATREASWPELRH